MRLDNKWAKSNRLFVRVCFLCVLYDCAFGLALGAATPRDELLRLVPDSVGFCFIVQDLRGHAAALQSSPFVEQLRQSSLAGKIRNSDKLKALDGIETKLKEKLGFDWNQIRDDIFGDALVLAYRPGSPGQPQQEQGVMLLRARNEKVLADLIERINKVQKEEGDLKELSECRHEGVVYHRRLEWDRRAQVDKPPTFYYVHGPILALSEQESMLRQVIDCDRTRSSGSRGEVLRRLDELDTERSLLTLWINPRSFDAEVDAKAENTPAERSAAVRQFTRYWKGLDSVVLSLSLHKRDIRLSLGLRARVPELPAAARRLFREGATTSEVWRRFPESALLAAGSRLDGSALLEVLGGFLTPRDRQALHETLNRPFAALLAEEDFTGSLLPALGPDWGLCLSAPAAGDKKRMPDLLFALRVDGGSTRKTIKRALLGALDFAARFVVFAHNSQNPDTPLAFKSGAVGSQEVHYLVGERGLPAGVQPAYGLLNGYLVLASSLESMNRFAQASPSPAPPAEASVPLLRISFREWRTYLAEHRESIVQFLTEHHKLDPDAAGKQLDGLLAGLQFVERAELSQRTAPGQVILSLAVQTAHDLRK